MNVKRSNNGVNAVNNQLAFEQFCKLSQKGYYMHVELKSKFNDRPSFWITAITEDGETEEIRLFLNQEILDLVLNYLESGILGDISEINPNDLDSFDEKDIDFKRELFQAEKNKGKKVTWSYTIFSRLASISYKQGLMIIHPYSCGNNYVSVSENKTKQETASISEETLIQIEINNLSFGSGYSLQVLSDYYALASNRTEDKQTVNHNFIINKGIQEQKTSSLPKLEIESKRQSLNNIA